MLNNSLGIYTNKIPAHNEISTILDFFKSREDLLLFSCVPQNFANPNFGVLPTFYMGFFDGCVVFLNENDMIKHAPNLKTKDVYLLQNQTLTNIDIDILKHELR